MHSVAPLLAKRGTMHKPVARPVFQGGARFSWRNHVIQNLRAYFMLYFTTIKWVTCVLEKIDQG